MVIALIISIYAAFHFGIVNVILFVRGQTVSGSNMAVFSAAATFITYYVLSRVGAL